MKKLLSLLLIICSIGVAYADDKSTVTSLKYVTDELNTRQDKFGANDGKAMTFTNVAGGNLPRDVKESLGTSTSDNGLPTVSAVNTGLENKQDEISAANTNTVVTYTGTPGTLGQKGIYQDTGTYATQSDNLIQASTFNAALRNGLENEFVCADRDPVSNQCWLWTIDNETENKSPNILDVDAWFNSRNVRYTKNGNRYTITGLGTAYSQPLELPYDTYTLSIKDVTPGEGAVRPRIVAGIVQDGVWQRAVGNVGYDTSNAFKTSFTGEFNAIRPDHSNSGVSYSYTYDEIQLEVGSTRTPYVPYNENIYIPQNQSAQNN